MRHIGDEPNSNESATGSRRSVLHAIAGIGAATVGGRFAAGTATARDRDCPPPVRFVRTYGGEGGERAYSVAETPDGGYLLGGTIEPPSDVTPPTNALAVKVDAAGDVAWANEYGGEGFDAVRSVVGTDAGGYGFIGSTESFGAAETDAWLFETDADGDVLWNRTYGGSGGDGAQSGIRTADGGYALAGQTTSPELASDEIDEDDEYGDVWLVKTDGDGNREFSRAYSTQRRASEGARAVIQTADGGYALLGDLYPPRGPASPTLIKTTETGDVEWTRRYEEYGLGDGLVQTADGGYAIVGDGTYTTPGAYLLKTDSTGERAWSRSYGIDRPYTYTTAEALVQTRDGGYVFVGRKTTLEGNLDPNDDVEPISTTDARLVKTDATGDVEWTDVYDGNGADWPYSLVQTEDGGYTFAGKTGGSEKDDPDFPDDDFLLVEVGGEGGD